ncbi:MAG: PPC domain-containing protein [Planctomycetota bacterium]
MRSAALVLFALAACVRSGAVAPSIETIEPRWFQVGGVHSIRIVGERLDRVSSVLIADDSLSFESYEATDEDAATLCIRSDGNTSLGEKLFWLVGDAGISGVAVMHLGAFPVLDEVEPNNDQSDAQRLDTDGLLGSGLSVRGGVETGDFDSFVVSLPAGQHLGIEVNSMRLGGSFFDAYVEVLDPVGRVIASNDDSEIGRQDPMLSFVAEQAGDYTINLREAAFGGDYESRYVMHLGDFPAPVVPLPGGVNTRAGGHIDLIGSAAGLLTVHIDEASRLLAERENGWLTVSPRRPAGLATPSPVRIRVNDLTCVDEVEPNNERSDCSDAGAAPVAIHGVLDPPGDVDHFFVDVIAGKPWHAEVFAERLGSGVDVRLEVFGPSGAVLTYNDDGVVHDPKLELIANESGRHVVRVSEHLDRGGPTAAYRLEIREPEQRIDLTVPVPDPLRPTAGQSIVLSPGGRFALPVTVRRVGFNDANVVVEATGLPDRVTCGSATITPNEHLAVLLFEAEQGAKLRSGFAQIVASAKPAGRSINSTLSQELAVVTGEPRQTVYHKVEADRLPLAVVPKAPFRLTATPPRAPIARDGALDLQVSLERAPGFVGEVRLSVPRLPAWVERTEEIVAIAPGETSAVFPIYAGDRAIPGEAQVIVVGEADLSGGRFTAASQAAPLRVRDPYAEVAIESIASEQGQSVRAKCRIEWYEELASNASVRLLGLPKHATAPEVEVSATDATFEIPISVGDDTPISIHNTLYVELAVPEGAGVVRQYLGRGGVLEVLEPGASARETESRLTILRRQAESRRSSGG